MLDVFPGRMPGACALMSAAYSMRLEAMKAPPAYVVAGSLFVGDVRVFGEDGALDGKTQHHPQASRATYLERRMTFLEVGGPIADGDDGNSLRACERVKDQTASTTLARQSTNRMATQTELCPSARIMISTRSIAASCTQ